MRGGLGHKLRRHLDPAAAVRAARALKTTIPELLTAERERWPVWLPVGVGAGIACYFALPREPSPWLGMAVLALALAFVLAGRRRPALLLAGLAFGAVGLGFASATLRTLGVGAPVVASRLGPVAVSGQVIEVEPLPDRPRLTLARVSLSGLGRAETPARVRIRLSRPGDVVPGDWISLKAILLPPPSPSAPGAFDFPRHAFFQQLGAVGFAVGRLEHGEPPADEVGVSFRLWLANVRHKIYRRIVASLKGTSGTVAAALMTGERGAIPADVLEAIRASGLAHLLAISGLHIGLVTGVLFFGIRAVLAAMQPVALRFAIKKWAAVGALIGALAYLLVTGATVPTQRAFLMVALVLTAVVLDRTAVSMRLVAWAALIVLLISPESLLGASFQMSFAAVIALVAAYELARVRLGRWRTQERWWRLPLLYLTGVGLTTLVASAATAPFVVYHFNRFAAFGLAANLVAVPITALWIMPWAVLGYLLMPLGLEGWALTPMGWGIDGVIAVARRVGGWPGAVVLLPAMPVWGLALVALGGLWLCLWQRRWRLFGVLVMAAGLAALPLSRAPDVLVAGDARLFAVRAEDGGLMLSSETANRFARENWLRRAGLKSAAPWPREASADGRLRCDQAGCIYRARGHTVALIKHPAAFLEDCWVADVIVSLVPLRGASCAAPRTVIDRFDIWRKGAYALWLDEGRVRIENVRQHRGVRPWAPPKKPRRRRPRQAPGGQP